MARWEFNKVRSAYQHIVSFTNMSTLVWAWTWCQISDKLSSKTMTVLCTVACTCHYDETKFTWWNFQCHAFQQKVKVCMWLSSSSLICSDQSENIKTPMAFDCTCNLWYTLSYYCYNVNKVQCNYNMVNLFQNPHNSDKSLPVRVRYGVSFVNLKSDLYSALVNAVECQKSCYTGPCYNGTEL